MHGLLPGEEAEILAVFEQWGEIDRSHRKLAHRGSYLDRFWVSPSTVRRVLHLADKHFRPLPRPASARRPFPEWAEYTPNTIWIYDTTHFTGAGMAVLIIEDLVSRKWLTDVVSVEETSTQVEVGFTDALAAEGLLEQVALRQDNGVVDVSVDDEPRPILLAVSDNGPQMTSGSTREFMALCAIAQHFGRPGHTDRPGLDRDAQRPPQGRVPAPARDPRPGDPACRTRPRPGALQRGQAPPGHRATSAPTTSTKDAARRSARPARPAWNRPGSDGLPTTARNEKIDHPRTPRCWVIQRGSAITNSDTPHPQQRTTSHDPAPDRRPAAAIQPARQRKPERKNASALLDHPRHDQTPIPSSTQTALQRAGPHTASDTPTRSTRSKTLARAPQRPRRRAGRRGRPAQPRGPGPSV